MISDSASMRGGVRVKELERERERERELDERFDCSVVVIYCRFRCWPPARNRVLVAKQREI